MRRVVAVWFPTWPTDRLRRSDPARELTRELTRELAAPPPDTPLSPPRATGWRMVVAAADQAARALGLHPAMPLAHARAMVPGLAVAGLPTPGAMKRRWPAWPPGASAIRRSPRFRPAGRGWPDITGCAHLHGGEAALLADLLDRLARGGAPARAAVADTPGAAHAMARFGPDAAAVVAPGGQQPATAPLPVGALRLPPETVSALRRLGFARIGQLAGAARGPLVRRFGQQVALRLDPGARPGVRAHRTGDARRGGRPPARPSWSRC